MVCADACKPICTCVYLLTGAADLVHDTSGLMAMLLHAKRCMQAQPRMRAPASN